MTTLRLPVAAGFAAFLLLGASVASAQTSTTGAVRGRVTDKNNGSGLAGVTVVATSPALQGSRSDITGEAGRYQLDNLPPGVYLVTFYYSTLTVQRKGVRVPLGQLTVVNQSIDPNEGQGEVINVHDTGTLIDPTSTNQGTRITQEQLQNIPVPGRTFGAALGQAAGASGDSRGVAFSGSTSLENQYIVDGVNTTGLTYGSIGTPLINDFIDEIQILTGGYQAEYGRATGGIVNVITKQGSNEFHGSLFATMVPYQVNRRPVREVNTSIDGTVDLDYRADFGGTLGGPLIKDRLWFFVGFTPQLYQNNVSRVVQRQMDCRELQPDGSLTECNPDMYADGSPDEDPTTGDLLYEEVDRRAFKTSAQSYQFVAKINGAVSPEHQGQISVLGTPTTGQGIFGVNGAERATRADFQELNSDVSGKWTSRFNDNKTEIELLAGWHRDKYDQDALDNTALEEPTTRVYLSNLSRFGHAGNESQAVLEGCRDSSAGGDPYPFIENCPVFEYWLDSPGFTIDNLEDRRSLQLKGSQRVRAAGSHNFKAGLDVEDNKTVDVRHFTGGRYYQLIPDPAYNQVRVYRYVHPGVGNDVCGFDEDGNPRACDYLQSEPITGETFNWAGFLQDSWQILPNLTFNAGLRYEEQRLRYAKQVRGQTDPFTMESLGKNALELRGMFAPRVGLIYDPTKEGRSRIFTHWGRFYESIPMALNDFSFSGTTLYGAFFGFEQCQDGDAPSQDSTGQAPNPRNCPTTIDAATTPSAGETYRGGTTVVTPGTRAQFMDEILVGGEYEVLEDLRVGLAYKDRRLRRVLEDVSIDNAETYIIGNPGFFPADQEERLMRDIDNTSDPTERALLEQRLAGFKAMRRFDRPRRDYQAIELTLVKRVSRNFFVQGSYTYSRSRGNYPGLLNDDTGEALPNISTQYDLAELLANRSGPLPQDHPHDIQLDGYYTFDFHEGGQLTTGIRFRGSSGSPLDLLGAHYLYGFGKSYLLPRGSQGRTPFVTNTDLHLSYGRKLAHGYELSVFMDVINLFNQEQTAITDELYTFDNVNPIVGGTREDLVFAKQIDGNGNETRDPIGRNIAYGTPLARYAPLFLRCGARFIF